MNACARFRQSFRFPWEAAEHAEGYRGVVLIRVQRGLTHVMINRLPGNRPGTRSSGTCRTSLTMGRTMRNDRGSRARSGFTLVELLVVIGIIAVLVAILLPALAKARIAAKNTVCASRIEQVLVACSAYLVDIGKYPANYVNDAYNMCYPHDQQSRTLNELSAYLGHFPDIVDATDPGNLPPPLVCPFVEGSDDTGRKWVGNGNTYWYTGYGYYARLDEHVNYTDSNGTIHYQNGVLRNPDECADARGTRRGVVWGDAVSWFGYVGGQGMWYYSHTQGQYGGNSSFVFWHNTFRAFAGRHLGFSDGSVEFDPSVDLDPAHFAPNVTYWDGSQYYWWF